MNNQLTIIKDGGPFFITRVLNHQSIKKNILDGISGMGRFGIVTSKQSIYNSDWFAPVNVPRMYIPIVAPVIDHHNNTLEPVLKSKLIVDNIWHQQYGKGDFHDWHAHCKAVFSNVYYIDLDNKNPKTSFLVLGDEIEVDVEEGMIITFPSFIQHCSKINKSNNIKTVISFNSNYED